MNEKRTLSSTDDLPAKRRFRADVLDLTINADISGQRAARLLQNASLAGTENIADLATVPIGKNSARDLIRKCFRNTKWPDTYELQVPALNPATDATQLMTLSILLPHELLSAVLKVNKMEQLMTNQQAALAHRPDLQDHLARAAQLLDVDPSNTVIAGIWVDSVPFNSDRSQSLETVSLSLVGEGTLRFPITAFPKAFLKSKETYEEIWRVMAWSFRAALCGLNPSARHDGSAFLPSDRYRRKLQGRTIPAMILGEVRGDWAMYKDILDSTRLPFMVCGRLHLLAMQHHEGPDERFYFRSSLQAPGPVVVNVFEAVGHNPKAWPLQLNCARHDCPCLWPCMQEGSLDFDGVSGPTASRRENDISNLQYPTLRPAELQDRFFTCVRLGNHQRFFGELAVLPDGVRCVRQFSPGEMCYTFP